MEIRIIGEPEQVGYLVAMLHSGLDVSYVSRLQAARPDGQVRVYVVAHLRDPAGDAPVATPAADASAAGGGGTKGAPAEPPPDDPASGGGTQTSHAGDGAAPAPHQLRDDSCGEVAGPAGGLVGSATEAFDGVLTPAPSDTGAVRGAPAGPVSRQARTGGGPGMGAGAPTASDRALREQMERQS